MPKITETVFISYRRSSSDVYARALYHELIENNYSVFLDTKNMRSGNWLDQIKENINSSGHFVLILAPDSLDACHSRSDIFRQEIETALDIYPEINIVPFLIGGFDFDSGRTVNAVKAAGKKFKQLTKLQGVICKPAEIHLATPQLLEYLNTAPTNFGNRVPIDLNSVEIQPTIPTEADIKHEDDFMGYFRKGDDLADIGDFSKAIEAYSKCLRLNPHSAEAYISRGFTFYRLGEHMNAMSDYKQALSLNHYLAVTYNNIGVICLEENQLLEAHFNFEIALCLDNRFSRTYFNRAKLNIKRGQWEDARSDLTIYSELYGDEIYGNTEEVAEMLKQINISEKLQIGYPDLNDIPF